MNPYIQFYTLITTTATEEYGPFQCLHSLKLKIIAFSSRIDSSEKLVIKKINFFSNPSKLNKQSKKFKRRIDHVV